MRRITVILMSIAALALASSCNKNLNTDGAAPDGYIRKTVHISASELLSGKAAFGDMTSEGYAMLWQSGDKVVVSVNGNPDLTQTLDVTPIGDGSTADFGDITLSLPEGAIEIFISTNTTEASAGRKGLIKHSPNAEESQKTETASCDPQSILLYAKKSYASAADVPDNIKVDFAHSTAYGRMTIGGISLNVGETVKFVEIQTPKGQNIGGNFNIEDNGSLTGGSQPSIIIRNITNFDNPVWFAIAPTVLNTEAAITVHVVTSENRHFEKTLNCSSKALEFKAGRVSKFTVDFGGIVSAPRQVKTVRDLVLLKNTINNDTALEERHELGSWLNNDNEILLANDLEYGGDEVKGNGTDIPEGVIFNGQNHAIKNAVISASIFRNVLGTVQNLKIEGGSNSLYLFDTVSGTVKDIEITGLTSTTPLITTNSGTIDGLTIDETSSYTCTWTQQDMGFVTLENTGVIENSEVSAAITVEDPERAVYNFGVFCPKCISGRFVKCVNKSNVTIATSTNVGKSTSGCSLGGIVGIIESTQSNNVNILDQCDNKGNITLTLNLPASDYHRICCVGGIAGGDYKGGTSGASGVWKTAEYPSTGVIYKCTNYGTITLNYDSIWSNPESNATGSVGMTLGGVIGATINDLSYCSNKGSVIGNFNVGNSNYAGAPKVGGVVGAAHGKVSHCDNESEAVVEINGRVRNVSSKLYSGTGPVCHPAFGGVAGCVGSNEAANSADSEINDCTNKSPNVTNNATKNNSTTIYLASVCGWTVAYNSDNHDDGNTGLPVINPE